MKDFYKSRIKTARMLVMQNLIFSGHHKRKGAEINGFEMLSKLLPIRYIGIAEEGVKNDLKTVGRPYQVWIGILTESDKDVTVQPYIEMSGTFTTREFDMWLTARIQGLMSEESRPIAGYCWAATPCMTFDLEGSEEMLIQQFVDQGVFGL